MDIRCLLCCNNIEDTLCTECEYLGQDKGNSFPTYQLVPGHCHSPCLTRSSLQDRTHQMCSAAVEPMVTHNSEAWAAANSRINHSLLSEMLTSDPQKKSPKADHRARNLKLPPLTRTRLAVLTLEASLVLVGWRPSSHLPNKSESRPQEL